MDHPQIRGDIILAEHRVVGCQSGGLTFRRGRRLWDFRIPLGFSPGRGMFNNLHISKPRTRKRLILNLVPPKEDTVDRLLNDVRNSELNLIRREVTKNMKMRVITARNRKNTASIKNLLTRKRNITRNMMKRRKKNRVDMVNAKLTGLPLVNVILDLMVRLSLIILPLVNLMRTPRMVNVKHMGHLLVSAIPDLLVNLRRKSLTVNVKHTHLKGLPAMPNVRNAKVCSPIVNTDFRRDVW